MVDTSNNVGHEAEYYFVCVDSFSLIALVAQLRGMGVPIPPEAN